MVFAATYPFLDIFWTTLTVVMWAIWIWVVITVLIDLFARSDMSGWGKAGWTILVVLLPWLGVLLYLVVHGTAMAQRRAM